MLQHCFNLCETVITSRTFRDELLRLIVKLFGDTNDTNYNTICRCYFYLDDTRPISDVLWQLINSDSSSDKNNRKELTAYQIAFDLTEYQNDAFLRGIFNNIPRPPYSQLYPDKVKQQQASQPAPASEQAADIGATSLNDNDNDADKSSADKPSTESIGYNSEVSKYWDDELLTKWQRLKSILLGMFIFDGILLIDIETMNVLCYI